jgi:hypothetical protein
VSTNPDPIDRTGRPFDLTHGDYYHGTAHELVEGDGARLLPHPSHPVPAAMAGALVVTHIEMIVGADPLDPDALLLVEFAERGAVVSNVIDEALFDLPGGTAVEPMARVMAGNERVLIRG